MRMQNKSHIHKQMQGEWEGERERRRERGGERWVLPPHLGLVSCRLHTFHIDLNVFQTAAIVIDNKRVGLMHWPRAA